MIADLLVERERYIDPLLTFMEEADPRLNRKKHVDPLPLPRVVCELVEAWREAVGSIIAEGTCKSLDGCYWLLRWKDLRHALFAGHAQDVLQAVDAPADWQTGPPR